MIHGTSLLAAVPQMRPRYWLGWWPLSWATAMPECTLTTATNHGLLVLAPCPHSARSDSTGPATGAASALFNKTGLKNNGTTARAHTERSSHTDWNRAWPVVTPKLSPSPVSAKAVWPGPKPCHHG